MLTITIFAAGLVCLAGVLGLRLGRAQAQAQVSTVAAQASTDERGITLQTLIVTAVLVLMAVAAGVVIVAITNNAADDLEQANPSVRSRCNEVEIYDPILDARNEIGRNGNPKTNSVLGSDRGCIPVCQLRATTATAKQITDRDEPAISSANLDFVRNSNRALDNDDAGITNEYLIFIDRTTLGQGTTGTGVDEENEDGLAAVFTAPAVAVRVNAAQNDCILVDAEGDEVS